MISSVVAGIIVVIICSLILLSLSPLLKLFPLFLLVVLLP